LPVLVIQAILSLRLTWGNSAFQDEALYLWAGHLQWANWLHGVPIAPAFPSYFSGAPVIYPPVGALGDSVGGLTGARLLSLCFMLGATALLWSATRQLFDDRAAFFAAAVFASTAAAQFLGAFATYDAVALMLLAAAAWCAVRSASCRHRRSPIMLIAATVALLVLADATKYAAVLWDPVVLALTGFVAARRAGWRAGLVTAGAATAATAATLTLAVLLASPAYWAGIRFSTLERSAGGWSSLTVLRQAGSWIGIIAALAIAGVIVLIRERRERALIAVGWTLAVAVLLAPAEHARIHTGVSLFKHVGYGGWFAAIMAGYAIAALTRRRQPAERSHRKLVAGGARRKLAAGCVVAVAAMSAAGAFQASHHYAGWPNSTKLIASLRALITSDPGRSLAEDPFVPSYYLRDPVGSWSSTWYFTYVDPVTGATLTGTRAYADAIRHHYFKVVVIGLTATPRTDLVIESYLRRDPAYQQVGAVAWSAGPTRGRYLIWHYRPASGAGSVP